MAWIVCIAVLSAFYLSYLLTAGARWLAPRLGVVDKPDGGRKRHGKVTPLLGGVAVYLGFLVVAVGAYAISPALFRPEPEFTVATMMLLISAGLFCLIGVVDDKWGMRAREKFAYQVLASLPFALWGQSISEVGILGCGIELGNLALPFTVFWLVACSNVINLVDGLDGLAGSVSLIAVATIGVLATIAGHPEITLIAAILTGSIGGFLVHNWPPAKIFMGDSGSLTLGFLVGALAIEASLKKAAGFTLAAPLVLISIPIFDTFMAILRRKLTGRSIGEADRGHIHHRLQDLGLTRTQVLLSLGGLCLAMAATAILASYLKSDLVAIAACLSVLATLVVARVFGHHEATLFLRHLEAFSSLIIDGSHALPARFLGARLKALEPERREEHWDEVCRRVEAMGGTRLQFNCVDLAGERTISEMKWTGSQSLEEPGDHWQFDYSLRRDPHMQASLTVVGEVKQPEKAHRAADLFRLLDAFCRYWPIDRDEIRPRLIDNEDHYDDESVMVARDGTELGRQRQAA